MGKVQSIEKASILLDCLWEAGQPLALSQLVGRTGWAKSTLHGILSTMVDCAIVEQSPFDGKYRLGYHLFELGSAVRSGWDAVGFARPHLLQLMSLLGESTFLARLTGNELILADCAAPRLGYRAEAGTRMPLHCTSLGKAILAHQPEAQVRLLLRHKGMEALTENTITSPETFLSHLETVRQEGIARDREEFRMGLQSFAAPIFDHRGECIYAIGVVGLLHRERTYFDSVGQQLKEAASAISHDLGYRG